MRYDASLAALGVAVGLGALAACKGAPSEEGVVALSMPAPAATAPAEDDPATLPHPGGPRLGAVAMAATIHVKPDRRSAKLGYLRAGGTVVRGEKPVALDDCKGGYYHVLPAGYVCAEGDA